MQDSPPSPFGEGWGEASTWRAGREVDFYYEKRNLENGDSACHLSFDSCCYNTRCYKLYVALPSLIKGFCPPGTGEMKGV